MWSVTSSCRWCVVCHAWRDVTCDIVLQVERHFIMQVVCEATQSTHSHVSVAALQCLVKIMSLYYQYMEHYMGPALFAVSPRAIPRSLPRPSPPALLPPHLPHSLYFLTPSLVACLPHSLQVPLFPLPPSSFPSSLLSFPHSLPPLPPSLPPSLAHRLPVRCPQITIAAMESPIDEVALQGIEFWSNVCDEEVDLAIEFSEVPPLPLPCPCHCLRHKGDDNKSAFTAKQ